MALDNLHEKRDDLAEEVLDSHRAYTSLMEEIEAIDWYNQRAAVTEDTSLKEVLIHNRDEEIEHACMMLEWIRRNHPEWNENLRTYLFREEKITELEEEDANEDEGEAQDLKIGKILK
jgi:ferritin-like protein